MRNLSFSLTTEQVRERRKTVTRRRGTWWARVLKPGDLLCGVEKSQGIKRGGLVRLGVIRVLSVRTEMLGVLRDMDHWAASDETYAEGFSGMSANDFVAMFRKHMGGTEDQTVTRIEFEYVHPPARSRHAQNVTCLGCGTLPEDRSSDEPCIYCRHEWIAHDQAILSLAPCEEEGCGCPGFMSQCDEWEVIS